MTVYAVALGSNMGARLEHLQEGISALSRLGTIGAVSGLYETAPVGGPEQGPYLNAVATIESDLEPPALLVGLHHIEKDQGRSRTTRWGPRTLDLDIVTSDGAPVSTHELTIPHPRAVERRFVLQPLAEVWPGASVGSGMTAAEALATVQDQEVELLSRDWSDPEASRPGKWWVTAQMVWFLAIAFAMVYDGSLPEGDAGASQLIGGLLIIIGGLLAYRSMRHLGPSLTAVPEPLASGALVESGPYRLARHPIYGGIVLFLTGTSLVLDSVPAVVGSLALAGFFWLKSSYEERQLRIAYPDYRSYRERVPRRLIPFVL